MAIGDNGGNNETSNKLYENTYYSRLRVKNPESDLSLGVSFRSGLLILEIKQLKDGFKYDTIEAIYLSQTKAKILADQIAKFKKAVADGTIKPGEAYGVNAGMNEKISYIGFHVAEDMKTMQVTIGKMNGSTGAIIESETVTFNHDYHFALEWDNIETMEVSKAYYDNLEIDQIEQLCIDFGRYMNGAIGYAVADAMRFDQARILKKMDPIYDKLGIERRSYGNNNGNRQMGSSFLDSRNSSSNHTSFDNIEDQLYDED